MASIHPYSHTQVHLYPLTSSTLHVFSWPQRQTKWSHIWMHRLAPIPQVNRHFIFFLKYFFIMYFLWCSDDGPPPHTKNQLHPNSSPHSTAGLHYTSKLTALVFSEDRGAEEGTRCTSQPGPVLVSHFMTEINTWFIAADKPHTGFNLSTFSMCHHSTQQSQATQTLGTLLASANSCCKCLRGQTGSFLSSRRYHRVYHSQQNTQGAHAMFPFPLRTILTNNWLGLLIEYFTWLLPWTTSMCSDLQMLVRIEFYLHSCTYAYKRCCQHPVTLRELCELAELLGAAGEMSVSQSTWPTDVHQLSEELPNKNTLLNRCLKGTCEQLTQICHTPSSLPSCQSFSSSIDPITVWDGINSS